MKKNELTLPSFNREDCKIGVVHLGVGNFHRSHQALYINNYLNKSKDLNWGICGINLRKQERENFNFLKKRNGKYILKTISPAKMTSGARQPCTGGVAQNFTF